MILQLINIEDNLFLPKGLTSQCREVIQGSANAPIDPQKFNLSSTILAVSLDKVPIAQNGSSWTVAALTDRPRPRLGLSSDQWADGEIFWLPQKARVFCPEELYWKQLSSQRRDLVRVDSKEDALAFVADPFGSGDPSDRRQIHPAEITPAPGYGALALVCDSSDFNTRRMLKEWHNSQVALCTNVERSIKIALDSRVDHLGAQCEIDHHGRYQLHTCAIIGEQVLRHKMIQDSWAGLADSAVRMIKDGVGI